MKKLLLIIFLIQITISHAQTDSFARNEIYVGYGFLSDARLILEFGNAIQIVSGVQVPQIRGTGAIMIGYNRYLTPKATLGAEYNYQYLQLTGENSSTGHVSNYYSFLNLMARFDYRYVNDEKVQIYSGLSLGPSFIVGKWATDGEEWDHFAPFIAYQFNLIGMRVGKKWGGYAELGFGRNGLLNVGFSGKF